MRLRRFINPVRNGLLSAGAYIGGHIIFAQVGGAAAITTLVTTVSSAAAVSTVLVPATVIGGAAFVATAGYQAYQGMRNRTRRENAPANAATLMQNAEEMIIKTTSLNDKELILENYTNELLTKTTEYLVARRSDNSRSHNNDDRRNKIRKIVIKPKNLLDFKKLLSSGLGLFNTEHLEITDANVDNAFILALREHVNEGSFRELKTLILKNNRLTANSLSMISEIGRKMNLTELDLSGNQLNSDNGSLNGIQGTWFENFFKDFHQNFPCLRSLNIQNINLNVDTIDFNIYLFARPSLLEKIDISNNEFGGTSLGRMLMMPEFQYNLNVKTIETGFNGERRVAQALATRKARIDALRSALIGLNEASITIHILNKLMNDSQNLPEELRTIFAQRSTGDLRVAETVGDRWQLLARQLKKLKEDSEEERKETIELFVEHKRSGRSDISFIVKEQLKRLSNAANNEEINLVFNAPGASFRICAADVLPELTATLRKLYAHEQTPIIKVMDLSNLGFTTDDLSNLLVEGLGDFQTSELRIANNAITDDFFTELKDSRLTPFQQLKTLDVSGNRITVSGLSDIAAYAGSVGIETLNLSENIIVPVTEPQQRAFIGFCTDLHRTVPSLTKLNFSNIGLTEKTLCLLKPLLRNMSLLTELDIDQSMNKKHTAYVNLLQDPDYQVNLTLKNVNTKNNGSKDIQQQVKKKTGSHTLFYNSLSPQERQRSVFSTLLQKFIHTANPDFPVEINKLLDHCSSNTALDFNISNRKKLCLNARHLQFHRDKAALRDKDYQFSPEVSIEEIVALKQNNLHAFWAEKTQNNLEEDQSNIDAILERHYQVDLGNNVRKAYELGISQQRSHQLNIYYVEDGTIRVICFPQGKQYIISRHFDALKLNRNSEWRFVYMGLEISIDHKADVVMRSNGETLAAILGADIVKRIPSNENPNKLVAFNQLQVVDSISMLVQEPAPIVHQFTQQRAANLPVAVSSEPTPNVVHARINSPRA